jgi:uncharacterized membrane protein
MQSSNLPEWLGNMLGSLLSGIVHALQFVFGGLGRGIGEFAGGVAHSMGVSASAFNIAWIILGILLLIGAVRALMRRSWVGGIVLLVIAVVVLGRLMN